MINAIKKINRSTALLKSKKKQTALSLGLVLLSCGLTNIIKASTEHAIHLQCAYRTLKVVFQEFPGPFMSIFHVFPGLFNRMDVEQVNVSIDNIEYTGQKCGNHLVYFP